MQITDTQKITDVDKVAFQSRALELEKARGFTRPGGYKYRAIDYVDPMPQGFEVQIPLVEYFERVTRHKADAWQKHFCQYLQDAALGRPTHAVKTIIHAQARLGKSRILAQTYPAWLLGHDPLHRIALATYNKTQSEGHSEAVISIINLPIHQAIFTDPAGWVNPSTAKDRWRTAARKGSITDTERSFNAVGLQSGLTGAGFDTLIIDDPYADAAEAFSPTVRKRLTTHFWEFTVKSRIGLHSNIFGMFHRYHMEDLAGYLLDTGKFDYLRYASIADGDYIHKKTGQRFPDPLDRKDGEYISERFTEAYYADKRDNSQVWNSMFQGRPTSEQGDFFHVDKIRILKGDDLAEYRAKSAVWVRGWDNAATKDAGDHSAGGLVGVQPSGGVLVENMKLAQLDPAARMELQKSTAVEDGTGVIITVPMEVGEAGKSLVFFAQQYLRGFEVKGRSVVNSQNPGDTAKKRRAWNFAIAVNSCQVAFASDEHLPDDQKWVDRVIEAMRTFGFTSFDDPIDAMSDAYNEANERLTRGPVINDFNENRNLVMIDKFAARFQAETNGQPYPKIPENFTVYAGVKLSADATIANSAAIVARAPEIANMPDKLFLVAEYKNWTGDMYECFDWLNTSLTEYCDNSKAAMVWLHPDSSEYAETIQRKLKRPVVVFDGSDTAGLTELGWYMLPTTDSSPFNDGERDTRFYGLVRDAKQLVSPTDSLGLVAFRQECASWNFDKDGKPNAIGGVADCVRMIANGFRTRAVRLTTEERTERDNVNPRFHADAITAAQDDGAAAAEISRMRVTRTVQMNMPKVLKGKKSGSRFSKFQRSK